MPALKEYQICSCGKTMFPCDFDENKMLITYQCTECDNTVTKNFDEVTLHDGDKTKYFVLNEAGEVTWKCPSHGYCDFTIDSFFGLYDFRGFEEMGCALCYAESKGYEKYEDEEMDLDYISSEKGKNAIKEIIDNLTDEQQKELVRHYDVSPDDVSGDCAEGIRRAYFIHYMDAPFKFFLNDLKKQIYDQFEIDLGFDDDDDEYEDGEYYEDDGDWEGDE